MGKTIEERIDDMEVATGWGEMDVSGEFEKAIIIRASIIADWNTAANLLRQALEPILEYMYEGDASGQEDSDEMILYREIEKHIAKMEGTDA